MPVAAQPERLVAYDCSYPQCGAVFATKKCLQRHVAVHEDSFECAIDESCGETFKTPREMIRHHKSHYYIEPSMTGRGNPPGYFCESPFCMEYFKFKNDMLAHFELCRLGTHQEFDMEIPHETRDDTVPSSETDDDNTMHPQCINCNRHLLDSLGSRRPHKQTCAYCQGGTAGSAQQDLSSREARTMVRSTLKTRSQGGDARSRPNTLSPARSPQTFYVSESPSASDVRTGSARNRGRLTQSTQDTDIIVQTQRMGDIEGAYTPEYRPDPGMAQSQDVCERCLSGDPYDSHHHHHHRASQPVSDADIMSEEEPLTLDSQATIPCGQPYSAMHRRRNRKAAARNSRSSQPSAGAATPSHRTTAAPASGSEACADEDCTQCCGAMGARIMSTPSEITRSRLAPSCSSSAEPSATQADMSSQLLHIFEDSDDSHRPHGAGVYSGGDFDGGHGDSGGDGEGFDLTWNNMDGIEEEEAADEKSKAGKARHRVQVGKKRTRGLDGPEDGIEERTDSEDDGHEVRNGQRDKGQAHKRSRRQSGDEERQQHESRSGRRQAACGRKQSVSDSSDEQAASVFASPATPVRRAAGGANAPGAAAPGGKIVSTGAVAGGRQARTASERKGREAPSEDSDSSSEDETKHVAQRRVLVTYGKSSSARTAKHSSKATDLPTSGDEWMPRQAPAKGKGKGRLSSLSLPRPTVKKNGKGPRGYLTCSVGSCPARCTNRKSLQMHMLAVHSDGQAAVGTNAANTTDNAMFQCPFQLCPRSYTHRRTLLEHLKAFHSGANMFKCARPGCSREFKSRQALAYHVKVAHPG